MSLREIFCFVGPGDYSLIVFRQRAASICGFVGGFVGGWVCRRKNLYALIGFQTANENRQKSHRVAVN